ncbi:SRPBCC family protein [Polynucleobacter sp. AP-Melu-500A-A1]|uniref:SRPBCC family protein n=1 Tax=Polynucleobacter sp. AP-Melu-500A-A1 TaxID=2576929 RepID=UPI001C0BCF2F|nr:SRPBCC family protein [Polynucleobacter sp. AP-Melu-500A-A1]MBU3631302.1 SRPBCC family protein [Polynucleobacter sp. AP-Melu-500A-A1]
MSTAYSFFKPSCSIMKRALLLCLLMSGQSCFAITELAPYDLQVFVEKSAAGFKVQASYIAPVSQCEAYTFLTDYEDVKTIPGIVESKVRRRNGNRVTVERLIEERILLFPVQIRSEVEFTELPNQGINFIQTKGDSKAYSGTWRLQPNEKGVTVRYASIIEPDSIIPSGVIEYFMRNNIRRSFEMMAEGMERNRDSLSLACR